MTALFLVFAAIIVFVLQRSSGRRELDQLDARHSIPNPLVEPDEQFKIVISLENRGNAYMPFLRWREHVPGEMQVISGGNVSDDKHGGKFIDGTTWLRPRQGLRKTVEGSMSKRGRYIFSELSVSCGDFLGMREDRLAFTVIRELVVLPREMPDQQVDQVLGGFLGDLSVNRFIFEDPILTVGFREYTGREPMKDISWTQSARGRGLLVRNYDHTVEPSVSVVLNVDCDCEDELKERCFSMARTVCRRLEEQGVKYSFHTDAMILGGIGSWRNVPQGLGGQHFRFILEGLGRASCRPVVSWSSLFEDMTKTQDLEPGIILITPKRDLALERTASRAAGMGGGMLLTLTAPPIVKNYASDEDDEDIAAEGRSA